MYARMHTVEHSWTFHSTHTIGGPSITWSPLKRQSEHQTIPSHALSNGHTHMHAWTHTHTHAHSRPSTIRTGPTPLEDPLPPTVPCMRRCTWGWALLCVWGVFCGGSPCQPLGERVRIPHRSALLRNFQNSLYLMPLKGNWRIAASWCINPPPYLVKWAADVMNTHTLSTYSTHVMNTHTLSTYSTHTNTHAGNLLVRLKSCNHYE